MTEPADQPPEQEKTAFEVFWDWRMKMAQQGFVDCTCEYCMRTSRHNEQLAIENARLHQRLDVSERTVDELNRDMQLAHHIQHVVLVRPGDALIVSGLDTENWAPEDFDSVKKVFEHLGIKSAVFRQEIEIDVERNGGSDD